MLMEVVRVPESEDRDAAKPLLEEILELHAKLCSGLADPIRIAILYELAQGPHNVGDLVNAMELPQSSVSRHLRILRDRQLVIAKRVGTSVYYELADREVIEALDMLRAVLRRRLKSRGELADAL